MSTDLWTCERRLWTDSQDAFAEFMDMEAVMIFPEPIGTLYNGDILSEVGATRVWDDILMSDRIERHRGRLAFLNYRAEASRAPNDRYLALCASVWQVVDDKPRIVAHQQTPVDMPAQTRASRRDASDAMGRAHAEQEA